MVRRSQEKRMAVVDSVVKDLYGLYAGGRVHVGTVAVNRVARMALHWNLPVSYLYERFPVEWNLKSYNLIFCSLAMTFQWREIETTLQRLKKDNIVLEQAGLIPRSIFLTILNGIAKARRRGLSEYLNHNAYEAAIRYFKRLECVLGTCFTSNLILTLCSRTFSEIKQNFAKVATLYLNSGVPGKAVGLIPLSIVPDAERLVKEELLIVRRQISNHVWKQLFISAGEGVAEDVNWVVNQVEFYHMRTVPVRTKSVLKTMWQARLAHRDGVVIAAFRACRDTRNVTLAKYLRHMLLAVPTSIDLLYLQTLSHTAPLKHLEGLLLTHHSGEGVRADMLCAFLEACGRRAVRAGDACCVAAEAMYKRCVGGGEGGGKGVAQGGGGVRYTAAHRQDAAAGLLRCAAAAGDVELAEACWSATYQDPSAAAALRAAYSNAGHPQNTPELDYAVTPITAARRDALAEELLRM